MAPAARPDRLSLSVSAARVVFAEAARLSLTSVLAYPLRSLLAILGIVIGIVTVIVVATVLVNLRNQVALLFRELGTENVFAYHRSGDPYQAPSDAEARRRPLEASMAADLARSGDAIREVAAQLLIPSVVGGRPLIARAGSAVSDTVLIEGVSANFFDVTGAELAAGRPFTELEDRTGARVAVLGAGLARALFGDRTPSRIAGATVLVSGETYTVVGVLAPRRGGFFGENRQDRILSIPRGAAARRFAEAQETVLYIRAEPDRLEDARVQAETRLRQLRRLGVDEPNDFNLSTSEQIIRTFDRISAAIGLATVALAAVSLIIGGIGIANVMVISVVERTREIGVRRALGARRGEVLLQFLIEATMLSTTGGVVGVAVAAAIGLMVSLLVPGFSAAFPLWAVASGLGMSCLTGLVAGYLPAHRAAWVDPVEALRYE